MNERERKEGRVKRKKRASGAQIGRQMLKRMRDRIVSSRPTWVIVAGFVCLGFIPAAHIKQVWWYMPAVPALNRYRLESKVILNYIVNARLKRETSICWLPTL